MPSYHPLPIAIETRLYSILGLTEYERRVLTFTRKAPLRLSSISSLTKIPRGSIVYVIKKLRKRGLLVRVEDNLYKGIYWRTNLPVIFREIRCMNVPSVTDWINPDDLDENI